MNFFRTLLVAEVVKMFLGQCILYNIRCILQLAYHLKNNNNKIKKYRRNILLH